MADIRKRKRPTTSLEPTDKRIALALDKYLPPVSPPPLHQALPAHTLLQMPHLLELPQQQKNFCEQTPHEADIPLKFRFNTLEWENMQYMTFVNVSNRGLTTTRGAWEDDMNSWGPAADEADARSRSSSGTPNPDGPKKPKVKIALKDYVHRKTGIRPPSIPTTASPTPDVQDVFAKSNGVGAQSLSTSLTQVLAEKSSAAKDSATDPVKQVNTVTSNSAARFVLRDSCSVASN